MTATEVIRLRVTPEEKGQLRERCSRNGTTMSEEIRSALGFAPGSSSPAERYGAVLARARANQESSGLPRLTEDEVMEYVASERARRAAEACGVARG